MHNFLKKYGYIGLILLAGIVLRIYGAFANLDFGHDQDLQAWFVRDVLINRHLRLIGQETSTQGIFIGPLYYYLLIPFYFLTSMEPHGGVYLATLLAAATILSYYFVFSKIFNYRVGLIAAGFYAFSFPFILNDRAVLPTTPVFLWTVWFLYCIYLFTSKKYKTAFLLIGFLAGMVWEMNMALILAFPAIFIVVLPALKLKNIRYILNGLYVFIISSLPLLIFEIRHNFSQLTYLIRSLTTNQGASVGFFEQFAKTINTVAVNTASLIYDIPHIFRIPGMIVLFAVSMFLFRKNSNEKKMYLVLVVWEAILILFFSLYSKPISEYYLNSATMFVFTILTAIFYSIYIKNKFVFWSLAAAFVVTNMWRLYFHSFGQDNYVSRRQTVNAIKTDALSRSYPCVSVSYLTSPGYDRGYRYLFVLENQKIKPVSETVPVYTIVYPPNDMYKVDENFGAIGLIYPDYKVYELNKISSGCEGEDFNLTDPMIGFTQ